MTWSQRWGTGQAPGLQSSLHVPADLLPFLLLSPNPFLELWILCPPRRGSS